MLEEPDGCLPAVGVTGGLLEASKEAEERSYEDSCVMSKLWLCRWLMEGLGAAEGVTAAAGPQPPSCDTDGSGNLAQLVSADPSAWPPTLTTGCRPPTLPLAANAAVIRASAVVGSRASICTVPESRRMRSGGCSRTAPRAPKLLPGLPARPPLPDGVNAPRSPADLTFAIGAKEDALGSRSSIATPAVSSAAVAAADAAAAATAAGVGTIITGAGGAPSPCVVATPCEEAVSAGPPLTAEMCPGNLADMELNAEPSREIGMLMRGGRPASGCRDDVASSTGPGISGTTAERPADETL